MCTQVFAVRLHGPAEKDEPLSGLSGDDKMPFLRV